MIPGLCMLLISCFLICSVSGGKNHMKNYLCVLPLMKEWRWLYHTTVMVINVLARLPFGGHDPSVFCLEITSPCMETSESSPPVRWHLATRHIDARLLEQVRALWPSIPESPEVARPGLQSRLSGVSGHLSSSRLLPSPCGFHPWGCCASIPLQTCPRQEN